LRLVEFDAKLDHDEAFAAEWADSGAVHTYAREIVIWSWTSLAFSRQPCCRVMSNELPTAAATAAAASAAAAAAASSSSKQQQHAAAASSSSKRQQQAAAASSSSKQQQQAAASGSSSKRQQAAAAAMKKLSFELRMGGL
jgi:cobalamin biosynthesis Mg chelatase CobN